MSCQPLPLSLTSKSKAKYFGKNLGILIFPITLLYKLKIVRVKVPSWTWYIIIYVCVACCPPVVETVLAWVSTSLARLFPDWRSNLLVLLTPRLDRDWSAASVNTRLHCQSSVQWATRQGEEGEERERERERELVIEQKMSNRDRPALVGRRFLSVTGRKGSSPPKLKQLYDWDWRAGWIRSSSSEDPAEPELQVR